MLTLKMLLCFIGTLLMILLSIGGFVRFGIKTGSKIFVMACNCCIETALGCVVIFMSEITGHSFIIIEHVASEQMERANSCVREINSELDDAKRRIKNGR